MKNDAPSIIIKGIGSYAPEGKLTNAELEKVVDTSNEWITTRTGIQERRVAAKDETTSQMAAKAATQAMKSAEVDAKDIDLLIVGTLTPDFPFPATSCLVQKELGLGQVMCFDISAACSGFLYTLEVASLMLKAGHYRNALVIGSEKMTSVLDWEDRTTCVLFGDGAGAVVLSKSEEPNAGIMDGILRADGAFVELLYQPAGGSAKPTTEDTLKSRQNFLKMNGREVYRNAVKLQEEVTLEVLEKHGISLEGVKCIIPHQANMRIIESLASRLNVPLEKFVINIDRYGNTSAASIPIAMDEAYKAGKLEKGDLILLIGMGAGLTWGATLIRWHI